MRAREFLSGFEARGVQGISSKRLGAWKVRVASVAQPDATARFGDAARPKGDGQAFFSISDLAVRWRVSRSAVYGYLRGYPVIDFAPAPGRKGHTRFR